MRKEDLGRYNPIGHTLTFKSAQDKKQHTVSVGAEGRMEAVLQSGHRPVGLDVVAPNASQRAHLYATSDTSSQATSESAAPAVGATVPKGAGVVRRETYGRYDPLTHTLAFKGPRSENEERVAVGAKGAPRPLPVAACSAREPLPRDLPRDPRLPIWRRASGGRA